MLFISLICFTRSIIHADAENPMDDTERLESPSTKKTKCGGLVNDVCEIHLQDSCACTNTAAG
jgi:hypothetical protein